MGVFVLSEDTLQVTFKCNTLQTQMPQEPRLQDDPCVYILPGRVLQLFLLAVAVGVTTSSVGSLDNPIR